MPTTTDPMAIPASATSTPATTDISKPLLYGVSAVTGLISGVVLGALAGVVMCLVTHPRVRHKSGARRNAAEREDDDADDEDDE